MLVETTVVKKARLKRNIKLGDEIGSCIAHVTEGIESLKDAMVYADNAQLELIVLAIESYEVQLAILRNNFTQALKDSSQHAEY